MLRDFVGAGAAIRDIATKTGENRQNFSQTG